MSTNFPNGLKSRGVDVLPGAGGVPYTGNVFFVDSGNVDGSDTTDAGKTTDRPFSTLDFAISQCDANNGDVIYVMPGHAESLVADSGVDIDVAGVTVVGLGNGEDRPIFSFATDTDADFKLAAANVVIRNLVFKCNIAAQEMMIETSGDDCSIVNCEFREGTATGKTFITIGVGDGDSDRLHIVGCKFVMLTAGNGDAAIAFAKDHSGVVIEDCDINGDFDLASIDAPAAGNAQVDLIIRRCLITNLLAGQLAIQINGTGSTGKIVNCYVQTNALATSIDAGGCEMFLCWHNIGTDQGGWTPVVVEPDSVTNILGANDSDNGFVSSAVAANEDGSILERLEQIGEATNVGSGTSLAANKSLVDALGTDGTTVTDAATSVLGAIGVDDADNAMATTSVAANEDGSVFERLEQIQEAVNKGAGSAVGAASSLVDAIGYDGAAVITPAAGQLHTAAGMPFIVKKELTSSAVVTGGVDVTGTASGGDIYIEEIMMVTDGTGLAAGTLFTIEKDGGDGLLTFFSDAVGNLGGNITRELSDGSTTASTEEILQSGQKLVAKCTATNCTGGGTITLYMKCRRAADGADLAAA